MSTDTSRVGFDATIDEVVDVNMRIVSPTLTYRHQRSQSQKAAGASFAVVVVWIVMILERPGPAGLAIVSVLSLSGGVLLGYLYGHLYDRSVRRQYRRIVREMYGGVETIRCEFELRQDVLWTRMRDVEVSFPWSRLTQLKDTAGSLEFWFDPGLVVVRDRAFGTNGDRRRFLETVQQRLGPNKSI